MIDPQLNIQHRGERRPLIAMVVNNAIAHDARVIKTATTLGMAGADVWVLGVNSSSVSDWATSGPVTYVRLPVLPPRGLTMRYLRWALARRWGRGGSADRWRRSLPVTAYYRRAFLPALRKVAPDAIHVHDVHLLGVVAEYAAGAADSGSLRPFVVYDAHEYVAGLAVSGARTQRSVDGWSVLEREFISVADRVITVADGLADRLQSAQGLSRRPTVVHNAPVALGGPGHELLQASHSLRDECGIGSQVPLAVYSGALSAARGVNTAVEVLGLIPDLHLAVVAVPFPHPMAAKLTEVAARVGAADRLHLVPPVPSHEVPAYLREADIAVSPIIGDSVSYDMALPNKLFEFLHAGLPMVVSDCRAVADFVIEHGLGSVFRAEDTADLARALREVLADPPHPDTTNLRKKYSWQGQQEQLLGVYQEPFPELRIAAEFISPAELAWAPVKMMNASLV
ncbi:MAG: glycosyltransferase family 4 protein [Actinomycetota bacterium]